MQDIKIAIEDWGLYNNGILVCKWWDSSSTYEEIEEYYLKIREKTEHQTGLCTDEVELFIADSEGWDFGEHDSVDEAIDTINELESLDEDDFKKIKLYLENFTYNSNVSTALDHLDDWICTNESDMSDVAYNHYRDCHSDVLDGPLGGYIDWDRVGRDMDIEGQFYKDEDGIIWEYVG